MKKVAVLLIAIMALFVINLNAQSIGAKVGGTMSQILITDVPKDDLKMKSGTQIGAMLSVPIIPILLDLQPEVILYQKGTKYSYEVLGVKSIMKSNLNYIEVPINIRLTIPMIPIYVIAGPYFGYAMSGSGYYKVGETVLIDNVPITFDKNGYHKFDYGIDAGIGFMKGIGPIHFFAELRYNKGFYDFDASLLTQKNSNIGLSVGVILGKK